MGKGRTTTITNMQHAMLAVLIAIIACVSVNGAYISSISPPRGSLGGGTRLSIFGSGFNRNNIQGTTDAFLGNDRCEIDEYHSSDTEIVCWTPPHHESEDVLVVVAITQVDGVGFATGVRPTFQFRDSSTPRLYDFPLATAAGSEFPIYGKMYGRTVDMYSATLGIVRCDTSEELNGDPALTSNTGTVYCAVNEQPAAHLNLTFKVHDDTSGYGAAVPSPSLWQFSPHDGSTWLVTQYPQIHSVSSSSGGLLGGASLTITGTGFAWDAADNVVLVAGTPCDITSSTGTEIVCTLRSSPETPAGDDTLYPGSRGLLRHYWDSIASGSTLDARFSFAAYPDSPHAVDHETTAALGVSGRSGGYGSSYGEVLTGFFVPPYDGTYSFFLDSDDQGELALSTDSSAENATVIARVTSFSDHYWQFPDAQISEPLALLGGHHYYMRIRHVEGSGADHVRVALRIHDPPEAVHTPAQLRHASVQERQVVATSANVVYERQEFVVAGAEAGHFVLVNPDNFDISARVTFDATASEVRSAISSGISRISGCGSFSVVREAVTAPQNGFKWTLTISCPSPAEYPLLYPANIDLALDTATSATDFTLTSERIPGTAVLGGQFTLALGAGGNQTAPISHQATSSEFEAAIEALPGVEDVSVSRSGNTLLGATWSITFLAPAGGFPQLVVFNASSLTGHEATLSTSTIQDGSTDLFLDPLPADFLLLADPVPSVQVWSNGILSSCDHNSTLLAAACHYSYLAEDTPHVTGLSPSSVTVGDELVINGTGFSASLAGNSVLLGSVSPCNVTAASPTQLRCIVDHSPAGEYPVVVVVAEASRGLAVVDAGVPMLSYPQEVDTASPASGSMVGGTLVTLTGTGFDGDTDGNLILLSANVPDAAGNGTVAVEIPCDVDTAAYDVLVCRTRSVMQYVPAHVNESSAAALSFQLVVNEVPTAHTFSYSPDRTPRVDAVAPVHAASFRSHVLAFTVSHFPVMPPSDDPTVSIAGRDCALREYEAPTAANGYVASIECLLLRADTAPAPQDPSAPVVHMPGLGYAETDTNSVQVHTGFLVSGISQPRGSLNGGNTLTITGAGFGTSKHFVVVQFVRTPAGDGSDPEVLGVCDITAIDHSSIDCVVSPGHHIVNDTVATVRVVGLSIAGGSPASGYVARCQDPALSDNACAYEFADSHTPVVTSAAAFDAVTNTGNLTITGHLLHNPAVVSIGPHDCPVIAYVSPEEIVCELPVVAADSLLVLVNVDGYGVSTSSSVHEFPLILDSLSPSVGSVAGNLLVTITGQGFASHLSRDIVVVGGSHATLVSASPTHITFRTPSHDMAGADATVVSATVVVAPGPQSVLVNDDDAEGAHDAGAHDAHMMSGDSSAASSSSSHAGSDPEGSVSAMLVDSFTYNSSLAHTPTLSAISLSSGWRGDVIAVSGAGFRDAVAGSFVDIGGAPCTINASTWTDTSFECTVGDSPAGNAQVAVTVEGKGLALPDDPAATLFYSNMEFTSASPLTGSFGGGLRVTLSGRGFPLAGSTERAAVTVCNTDCVVKETSYDAVVCETSELVTAASIAATSSHLPAVLSGQVFGEGASAATLGNAFDSNIETDMKSSSTLRSSCHVGIDVGTDSLAVVTRVRFFPAYHLVTRMSGGVFEGSTDGTTYTPIATLDGRVQEGWNFVDVDVAAGLEAQPQYRYLRYRGPTDGYCHTNELQFVGHLVSAQADGLCPISLSVLPAPDRSAVDDPVVDTSSPVPEFQYDLSVTPVIASVSPDTGSSLGGTNITISGSGFGATSAVGDVEVVVNGIPCAVYGVSDTEVHCTTGARPPPPAIPAPGLVVTTATTGSSLKTAERRHWFRYLDRWSDLGTWQDREMPVEGDFVVIPHGQNILLDVSPPELSVLMVQGSLVFDRKDLSLDATYIFVFGGTFEVGTEDQPFMHKATITLHGDRYETIELPEIGAKCLVVLDYPFVDHNSAGSHGMHQGDDFRRGVLDLHGEPRKRTWTKVSSTVAAGDQVISLDEEVDFRVGDRLIITPSERGSMWQTENIEVAEVLSPTSFRTTQPLRYTHRSEWYHHDGFAPVDMRVEVGLISRNVVVQGDERSDSQLFGVHTAAMHGAMQRISGVEFRRCGQAFVFGRYCTHSHVAGHQPDMYIKDNSIHHSFQRAVTIHGTHHALVRNNVAWHVRGHTFFVEDGDERFNVFEENLCAVTLSSPGPLMSDSTPANFWTASPNNIWRHNVAAGSASFGYWFELTSGAGGTPGRPRACPRNGQVVEFFNNTAHSSGGVGFRIYPHWSPMVDECNPGKGPSPQYMYNLTSFRNGGNGIFHRFAGDVHWINAHIIENGGAGLLWKEYGSVGYKNNSHVQNSLFVGHTDPARAGGVAIHTPQDEFWIGGPVTLVNYGNSGALRGCASCDSHTSMKQGGFTVRWQGLKFINTNRYVKWTAPYKQIFWDLDGSLTGEEGGWATPFYGWNNWNPACGAGGTVYDDGMVCDGSVVVRRLQIDRVDPRELDFQVMQMASAAGLDTMPFRPKEIYGWVLPVVGEREYQFTFRSLVDWRTIRIRYSEPEYVDDSEWVFLSSNHTDYRLHFRVHYAGEFRPWLDLPDGRLPDPTVDQIGTGAMGRVDDGTTNNTWSVVINSINATTSGWGKHVIEADALQCPISGCPLPPEPSDDVVYKRWSLPSTWPSGRVPVEGEAVVIEHDMGVLLDVSPPKLGKLTIEGHLRFVDDGNKTLNVDAIVVFGSLQVGTADAPFQHHAEIVIHGIRTSPTVVVDNAHFLGNKVLVSFGKLELIGRPRNVTWTRLAATAASGSTSITLAHPVDWVAGEEVVITPTEYDTNQLETAFIQSVSADNRTLVLTAPLAHSHAGETVTVPAWADKGDSGSPDVVMAAAVGLLSRNVRLVGADVSASTPNYGAHVVIGEIKRKPEWGGEHLVGVANISYAQLHNCGKMLTEHPAVTFRYLSASNPVNHLRGNAFSHSFNYAIVAELAQDLDIRDNVFHRTFRTSVDIWQDSDGAVLLNNLVAGTLRSPDETTDWVRPFAAFYLDGVGALVAGNVAAGSEDAGFVYRPDACSAAPSTFHTNEVHSAKVGFFVLSTPSHDCAEIRGVKAWKIAHVAILTVDQLANLEVHDAVVSDSHIGISLNFIRAGSGYGSVMHSLIMGSTSVSDDCSQSSECRAMSVSDAVGTTCGSVLGRSWRRVGVLTSQYTNAAKTCERDGRLDRCRPPTTPERMCSLPWEKRYGFPNSIDFADLYVRNSVFAHFADADCGLKSRAVAHNPSQIDYTPPMTFSGISWHEVEYAARFSFGLESTTPSKCASSCDSYNFVHIRDEDGSVTGTPDGVVMGQNPPLSLASPACDSVIEWGGYSCPGLALRAMKFMTRGSVGQRVIGPIKVTRFDPSGVDHRTYWSVGPFADLCAKKFPTNKFNFMVLPGREYEIFATATLPNRVRFQFWSDDPSDAAVVHLFLQKPNQMDVFVDGVKITPLYEMPTLDDVAGTYLFHPQERRLYFTLRGGSLNYDIVRKPVVQLTVRLAVSIEEFFAERVIENIALLLQIDESRIRIADVFAGSVVASIEIEDEAPTAVEDIEVEEQYERLANLTAILVQSVDNGTFDIGYEVEALKLETPDQFDLPENETEPLVLVGKLEDFERPIPSSDDGLSPVTIALIAVGSVVGVMAIVAAVMYFGGYGPFSGDGSSGSKHRHKAVIPTSLAAQDAAGAPKSDSDIVTNGAAWPATMAAADKATPFNDYPNPFKFRSIEEPSAEDSEGLRAL